MEKKSFLKIGGAMLLMAIVLNIQYAWGDYGVKDNPLHLEVLAQNNDTGDGTAAEFEGPLWYKISKTCSSTVTGVPGSTVTIYGVKIVLNASGFATLSFSDVANGCVAGGFDECSSYTCFDYWIKFEQTNGTAAN